MSYTGIHAQINKQANAVEDMKYKERLIIIFNNMTPFHTCYLMKVSQLSEPKKQYFVANQTNETTIFNPRHCALVWSMCSPERKIQSFEFLNLSILFLLFTFLGDMLLVHYQIEIQKLLKNCHPFWEAWGISCKYLSKDIELYCFSKETPKNGYIPPIFLKVYCLTFLPKTQL